MNKINTIAKFDSDFQLPRLESKKRLTKSRYCQSEDYEDLGTFVFSFLFWARCKMNWRHVEFTQHIWLILIVILDIYAKVHALLDKFYFTYLFNWDVVIQRLCISLLMRMSTFMKNWVHLFWCYFYLYFSVTPTIILKVLYRFAIYYELSIHFYRSLPLCAFLFLFTSTKIFMP